MPYMVKDWKRFQHFKDRRPPWIKMYRDLLDDPDWHDLDGDSAKALCMIWLIASEDETQQGVLPDLRKLAFRMRKSESEVKQYLKTLSHWIVSTGEPERYQLDITTISERYQLGPPEGEGEEYICPSNGTRKFQKPTVEDVRDYCRDKGYQVDAEKFVNFYESKGWMVGKNKMKNWKASVATWQKNQPKQKTTYMGNEV